mgnify:CR=1 FL=1
MFQILINSWIGIGVVTFLTLLFISAPYGRHIRSGWGPLLSKRVGWILMETPALYVMWLFYFLYADFTNNYKLDKIVNKTVFIRDIPESQIADKIKEWESALNKKIKLAYLPRPGVVRLRLTTAGSNEEQLNSLIRNELDKLRKYIQFYEDDINLNQLLHDLFSEKQFSLSVCYNNQGD